MSDSGCRCQACGHLYTVDLIVPDEVWERIKPASATEGAGLLCPACIGSKLAVLHLGSFAAYSLSVQS